MRTAHQDLGQPAIIEERRYDRTGQEQLLPAGAEGSHAGGVKRITDLDDETGSGSTTYDAGTAYGAPSAGALDAITDQVQAGESDGGGQSLDRITYDSGVPFGGRTYDATTGAYDESGGIDSDGVERMRERHHHRVQGRYHGRDSTGYYANEAGGSGRRVEFEVPDTGARLRRESDVEISEVI